MTTRIFGYLRFSYLGRSDVRLARQKSDIEERKSALFNPKRLEQRFYLFEQICLPSLRNQTDQDFKFVIFSSPEMPDIYKDRLEKSTADIPQIEIVYDTAPHINDALDPWIARQPIIQQHRTAHFRLDDDDALALDHIATVRANMERVPDQGIITRPQGLLLIDTPEGPRLLRKFEPYIAIGFTLVNPAGGGRNPYNLRHGQHHMLRPSLMMPRELGYIHTAHSESDTVDANGKKLRQALEYDGGSSAKAPQKFAANVLEAFGARPKDLLRILRKTPSTR